MDFSKILQRRIFKNGSFLRYYYRLRKRFNSNVPVCSVDYSMPAASESTNNFGGNAGKIYLWVVFKTIDDHGTLP
jgi:hypothetical protein